ncbi:hypothetical protein [Ralstonia phage RP31]|uniref:Uncharacterized protein n=2 Tax=Ripduovirus RP12 TaxID=2560700 RepID=A0A1L7N1B9_9CAUD|nr:hypothetical protein FDH28_gp090 [Ralstonia phage RP12]BAW19064.1 hypothetical protein [Ralstonia phage RP12]BAW19349.1 hypothetical protein [Ralstonia phage RP31]
MSAVALLLGSIFLFLGIRISMDAKVLHMLGFRREGKWMAHAALAMAVLGFVFWNAGSPKPSIVTASASETYLLR